jgi:hypothetical protein
MARRSVPALTVGDLVARVEAPTVFHRVTTKFPGYVRTLPYQRSGKEVLLMSIGRGKRAIWTDGTSQWIVVGHD